MDDHVLPSLPIDRRPARGCRPEPTGPRGPTSGRRRAIGWSRRLVVAGAAVSLALAACGDDGDGDGRGSGAEAERTTSTTVEAAPAGADAEPTCEDGTLDGRGYTLCTAGDGPDQGLVVAIHGRGSSAQEMQAMSGIETVAAGEGLAVVYPASIDGGWGDDTFTSPARPSGEEDVTFLDALVAHLREDRRIDDQPVGIVGFSNGASMALRYAVERPDDVRAVVAVAGQLPRDPAIRPPQPVSLLEVYGTADPIRGYDTGIPEAPGRQPGQPTPTLSTPETVAIFVGAAGAGEGDHEGPTETDPDPGDGTRLRTERWAGDDGTVVVLHAVIDGGHTWPSARIELPDPARYGPVSRDLDASAQAVAFILDPGSI